MYHFQRMLKEILRNVDDDWTIDDEAFRTDMNVGQSNVDVSDLTALVE